MYTKTEKITAEMVRMYRKEKKTIKQIEAETGYNYRTVYRRLKEAGVILRPIKRDNRGKFLPFDIHKETE